MKKGIYTIDLQKVVNEINKIKCPVHNDMAKAEIIDGQISTTACCDEIYKEINKVMNKTVQGDVDRAIMEVFKKKSRL